MEKNVPIALILPSRWQDGAESLGKERTAVYGTRQYEKFLTFLMLGSSSATHFMIRRTIDSAWVKKTTDSSAEGFFDEKESEFLWLPPEMGFSGMSKSAFEVLSALKGLSKLGGGGNLSSEMFDPAVLPCSTKCAQMIKSSRKSGYSRLLKHNIISIP